jgi:Superinfection immunity protein
LVEDETMDIAGFLLIALALAVYFLPSIISSTRTRRYLTGIFWVNLLFGWTVLGWIAALIWAVMEKPTPISLERPLTDSPPEVW